MPRAGRIGLGWGWRRSGWADAATRGTSLYRRHHNHRWFAWAVSLLADVDLSLLFSEAFFALD